MLRERAKKEIAGWMEYYEGLIAGVMKRTPYLLELCDMVEGLGLPIHTDVATSGVAITFESIEEARVVLGKILEVSKIEKFIKVSHPASDKLKWSYYVDYHGVDLNIYPAEPNKDCVAVKRVNTYTSWVCEQA